MNQVQRRLISGLYRVDCPTADELGEYQLGLLPDNRQREIASHLADCPLCSRESSDLQAFWSQLEPDLPAQPSAAPQGQSWLDRLRVLLAQPVFVDSPALAAVRGTDDGPRLYRAGDVQVSIDVQADESKPGQWLVDGLITGIATSGWAAHLQSGDQVLASAAVDAAGNFGLSAPASADYQLILGDARTEVHLSIHV